MLEQVERCLAFDAAHSQAVVVLLVAFSMRPVPVAGARQYSCGCVSCIVVVTYAGRMPTAASPSLSSSSLRIVNCFVVYRSLVEKPVYLIIVAT